MGAAHAKAVYGLWGHLPHASHRLLVFMAFTAKDGDDPPTFSGGRETLAFALGRKVPTEQTAAAQRVRNASYVAVRSAVQHLIDVGAIIRDRRSSPGRTTRYILADPAVARPGSDDVMSTAPSHWVADVAAGLGMTAGRLAVARYVASTARGDGTTATVGIDAAAAAGGVSVASARRCLHELRSAGWLEQVERGHRRGDGTTTVGVYRLRHPSTTDRGTAGDA